MDRLSSAIRCKNIRGNLCALFTLHAHRLMITFLFNIYKKCAQSKGSTENTFHAANRISLQVAKPATSFRNLT